MADREPRRNMEDDDRLRGESDEQVRGIAPDEDTDDIDDDYDDDDEDKGI